MTEFNLYRVYYYSAPQFNWDVRIDLYMGGAAVGTLLFMKAGQPIPANTISGGIPRLHYSISHFPAMMSMLREEKPLFVNQRNQWNWHHQHEQRAGGRTRRRLSRPRYAKRALPLRANQFGEAEKARMLVVVDLAS